MYIDDLKENIYTCNRTRCGFCRENCPVYSELRYEAYSCRGKMLIARGLIEGSIKPNKELIDCISLCTTCGYCLYRCALNNVDLIESLRADLINMGHENKYHRISVKNILDYNNPFKESNEKRSNWSDGLPISKSSNKLFFAGCVYPYLQPERLKKIYCSLIKLGFKLNYFGENERCCGAVLSTTGYLEKFHALSLKNIEIFNKKEIEKIITPCPGCYKILKNKYVKLETNFNPEILHYTEALADLLKIGRINFQNKIKMKVTWHDPCDLGRHMRILEYPRIILTSIPGIELLEMDNNKYEAKCCGAGGGMLSANADLSIDIATKRLNTAEATGAEALVTMCPTCESTFERVIRYTNSKLKLYDLGELVFQAL
ncbi:MAG: (Fe-S)-binding protein [Candidatus Helarchaeota archaeon]|nr:(Fe-S)-binding protein [Candidatus Helarchaeota archaeon]